MALSKIADRVATPAARAAIRDFQALQLLFPPVGLSQHLQEGVQRLLGQVPKLGVELEMCVRPAAPAAGTEVEQRLRDELRRLILAKEYTRRYADFLCADAQLIAMLAAEGDARLRDLLAVAGVPLLHRKHLVGFVREAQSRSEIGPANMDQSVDPVATACAAETEADEGEDVICGSEASSDGMQGVTDAVVGNCLSESVPAGGIATRGEESVREISPKELVASSEEIVARSDALVASRDVSSPEVATSDAVSSDEVIPAPKARLFCASSFGGEAW